MCKHFTSHYLILKLRTIIFQDCHFKVIKSNRKLLELNTYRVSYLGISSHTLEPSTCHMATWYSQVMGSAAYLWCRLKIFQGSWSWAVLEYTKYTYEAAQMHQCFHQQPLQRSLITSYRWEWKCLCTPLPSPELWLLSSGPFFCNSEFLTWYFSFSIFFSWLWGFGWHSKIF